MKSLERIAFMCLALAILMAFVVIGQMVVQATGMPAHASQAVVPYTTR